jgi:hypothetical protein
VNSLHGGPLVLLSRSSWKLCPLLALVACGDGTVSRSFDGIVGWRGHAATPLAAARAASSPLSEGAADSEPSERRVYLRLRNSSEVEFDWVQVWGPQGEVAYQVLPAHAESEYVRFDAYPHNNLRANSGQTRYVHRVSDFAESPLNDGYYTYVLGASPPPAPGGEGALTLQLARDDSTAADGVAASK